jgi:outer membrane protein assembly factor BamB
MVFVETDSSVTALNAATGDTVWVAQGQNGFGAGAGTDTPLVVANGVVYTMPFGVINETTGQILFQDTAAVNDGSIIVANGDVYLSTDPYHLAEYSQ